MAYLRAGYFERWHAGLEMLLVEKGVLTREEIAARVERYERDPGAPVPRREGPAPFAEMPAPPHESGPLPNARFALGDRIVNRNAHPTGHTRLPRYGRGKHGLIERVHGVHAFPDTNAHGLGAEPQPVYGVRFEATELWRHSADGRVFGLAVTLCDHQVYDWNAFRDRLVVDIAAAEEQGDISGYYERWLASFERLLLDTDVITAAELDTRTAEYAAGVWDEHGHYETTSNAIASLIRSPHTSGVRNIVWRADGVPINVFRRPGQLFVCATGCCCGHTERGHASVPVELYHSKWVRRRIGHKVHLSLGGCLGPCALSNVVLLLYAGREVWFHSVSGDEQVVAIYDYIEAMVRADRYLLPPTALAPQVFGWPVPEAEPQGDHLACHEPRAVRAPRIKGTSFSNRL